MPIKPEMMECLSDYAGFFGALIAFVPPLRSSIVYLYSRRGLKKYHASPGSISDDVKKILEHALSKASYFNQLDVTCLLAGFALLIISFLLKILAK